MLSAGEKRERRLHDRLPRLAGEREGELAMERAPGELQVDVAGELMARCGNQRGGRTAMPEEESCCCGAALGRTRETEGLEEREVAMLPLLPPPLTML